MLDNEARLQEEIARLTQQRDEERAEVKRLKAIYAELLAQGHRTMLDYLQVEKRLTTLAEILTDPVNQLEQTPGGYYIYRFDLATMHHIADAIGVPKSEPVAMMATYTLEELPQLIRPD